MPKNSSNYLSHLDFPQVLKDVHQESEHALDVILTNDFVPKRYTKVGYKYKDMGDGTKEVEYITWYGEGVKQKTYITCRGNPDGKSEITTISFVGKVGLNLDGKYWKIYDDVGSVGVYFDVDNTSVIPTTGCDRDIEVDITALDTANSLALKLKNALDSDSKFSAMNTSFLTIVSSSTVGDKTDASDIDTGLGISVTSGVDSINNKYFILYSANDEYKFHVWYNLDGSGVDPAPADSIGIEVNVTSSDSDKDIATKSRIAISEVSVTDYYNFTATNENDDHHLVITNFRYGETTDTVDYNSEQLIFRTVDNGVIGGVVGQVKVYYDDVTKLRSFIEKII